MHKNIVFDIGNVLYIWNPDFIISENHLSNEEAKLINDHVFSNWNFMDYGGTEEDFINLCCKNLPVSLHSIVKDIAHNWIKYLVHYPLKDTWKIKDKLKEKHKVFLLSNIPTNVNEQIDLIKPILTNIDGYIFSGENKVHKPEAPIFELLLSKYQLDAKDCLFVDDRIDNINGAKSLGFDTYLFDYRKTDEFVRYLKENNDL